MKINLRKLREDRSMSQTDLAILVGTKQNYISEIESGKKIPSLKMLKRIADALDVCTALLLIDKNCCSCNRCREVQDEK